ncbi:ABC sugar transporter, inner membrane subunit [Hydrogenophaga taeniospiralis CCUG 15921]|uniref:Xylose transport system permease protein XylH n=1 Tax=Hydrogenophaga taeniospiralis CCUG 15921 TaxID=1281780 RepID=A0A9X4NUI9_9BURK|nr:ABC transporter permease [Hydrogenophaga taeniospiralis]MDG5978233.1 ABC sugar transporter, inner membrane subunit [Hydrogenophaga taeniospiralis CCUG 15921]
MASANLSGTPANLPGDERMRNVGALRKLLARPEFGAIAGTLLVVAIFVMAAGDSGMFSAEGSVNWGTVAAFLGIIAVGAALLMIAGEFDLSVGSMIGFAGMMVAIPILEWGWAPSLAVLFAFACAMALGWLNGWLVIKTGLPSFIVTLAFFFILRGLSLAVAVLLTGKTILSSSGDVVLHEAMMADPIVNALFHGHVLTGLFDALSAAGWMAARDDGTALAIGVPKVVVWWLLLTAVGAFVLARTRAGNWILSVGGDANAAKNVGIPVAKVKIGLFMFTAFCATLFAVLQVADAGSAAADRGLQKEFEAIIAAVIGGCLLTGGYGSVIGAAFGALIFGMVQIGIGYTSIDNNWYRVFLGVMLLIAVLFNNYIRRRYAMGRT